MSVGCLSDPQDRCVARDRSDRLSAYIKAQFTPEQSSWWEVHHGADFVRTPLVGKAGVCYSAAQRCTQPWDRGLCGRWESDPEAGNSAVHGAWSPSDTDIEPILSDKCEPLHHLTM